MGHKPFLLDLAGRLGAPILAATLVGCLLQGKFELVHGALMLAGLTLVGVDHSQEHHRRRSS